MNVTMGKGECLWYTTGHGVITVHFPENRTYCQYCPYCRNEDSLKRYKCLITGEYILYPFDRRGDNCPIILDDVEEK